MGTPVSLKVRVLDLNTSGPSVLATSTNVLKSRIKNTIDAVGELEIGLPFDDPVTPFLIAACGGAGFNSTILPYGLEFSYDGGSSWDSAMWAENHTLDFSLNNLGIDLTGNDISDGFNRIYIDHVTFVDVNSSDILYGDFGAIAVGDNALIKAGPPWLPWQRGLLRSVPGRSSLAGKQWLAFQGVMDSHLAGLNVTFDDVQDSVFRCVQTLMKALGGVYKPAGDTAPFGSRQHFTVDVKNRIIHAGYVGTTPKMTFVTQPSSGSSYALDETQFAYITGDTLTVEPNLQDMRAQVAFIGGTSNHGLPDGAKITCVTCVNNQIPDNPIAWDSSLLVIGCSTGNGGGGLFYLVDKNFYPVSQQVDINDLACDSSTNLVYAATDTGIIYGNVSSVQQHFPTLGGLTASVATIHLAGTTITAVANSGSNGTGVNGVYVYPSISTDADNTDVGYAGWSRVTLHDVVDAVYFDGADSTYGGTGTLFYIDSSALSTLIRHVVSGSQAQVQTTNLTYEITGFDVFSFAYSGAAPRCVIRTSGGSLGVSCITSSSLTVGAWSGLGLNDEFGALAVNKIIAYPPEWSINGVPVTFLASTDRGLYYCTDYTGNQWYPCSGQNGINEVSGSFVAAGTVQGLLGRNIVRLFVASDTALFVSSTGGIYFQEILSQPLDLGPAFYALAQQANARPFPDNNVGGIAIDATSSGGVGGGIGSLPTGPSAPVDNTDLENNGGAGTIVYISPSNPLSPALGLVFCRRVTETNDFTYRVIDVTCEAPYNAIEPSQLSEMAANAATDALTGSLELLVEHYRYLLICRQPKVTITLNSSFTTREAALRTLLPGDMVSVDFVLTSGGTSSYTIVDLTQQNWYVWSKEMTTDGNGTVDVALTLVSVAGFAAIDLQEIVSAVANGFGRDRRFRSWHVR